MPTGRISPVRLAEGDRLGKYLVGARLGEGGMGCVYSAVDTTLARPVALKVLTAPDDAGRARFLHEARAQARIDHPGVCRVHEAREVDGVAFIAMQLVAGDTLEGLSWQLARDDKVRAVAEAAEAVHAGHRLGLVHRDLKPSNLLVERDEDGRLRTFVADFGLVRELEQPGLTVAGASVGTPLYMAPEQARSVPGGVDRRTDVYGLCATLYVALTDFYPYPGATTGDVIAAVVRDEPVPIGERDPSLPRDLATIVMKGLSREKERRYETAAALAEDLRRFLAGEPIAARRATPAERVAGIVRRHTAAAAVAAIALCVLAVVVGLWLRSSWLGRRRAEAARRAAADVARIESALRVAALLPLHDTAPERARLRQELARLDAETAALGSGGRGVRGWALGRAHLALGEAEEARRHLAVARDERYGGREVSYALGLALGQLYQEGLDEVSRLASRPLREARRKELERTLRDPALAALAEGRGLPGTVPAFVEGLVAAYEKRWDAAERKLDEAAREAPWLHEVRRETGEAALARAQDLRERGDEAGAEDNLTRARSAFGEATRVARSDSASYEGLCRLEWAVMLARERHGLDPEPAYRAAITACALASSADSTRASVLSASARVHARWAEHLLLAGNDPAPAAAAAIEAVGRGLALEPREAKLRARLHSSLGLAYRVAAEFRIRRGLDPAGPLAEAATAWQRAADLDPNDSGYRNNLGVQLKVLAEHEEGLGLDPRPTLARSVAAYREAVRLRPDYANAFVNLGNAERMCGEWEERHGLDPFPALDRSAGAARAATVLNPTFDIAWNNLGATLVSEAERRLARDQDPRPALAAALEALGKALSCNPRYAYAHGNSAAAHLAEAGWLLRRGDDPAGALASAAAAAERRRQLDPGAFNASGTVAKVHLLRAAYALRDGRDARPALREAARAIAAARRVNASAPELAPLERRHALLSGLAAAGRRNGTVPPLPLEACLDPTLVPREPPRPPGSR